VIKQFEQWVGLKVSRYTESAIPAFYELTTTQGIYYVSNYYGMVMHSPVYQFNQQLTNLTEQSLNGTVKDELAKIVDTLIVYQAPQQKYQVTVFTDVNCNSVVRSR
jgi:thiol:disulfide interchange protein DsbC